MDRYQITSKSKTIIVGIAPSHHVWSRGIANVEIAANEKKMKMRMTYPMNTLSETVGVSVGSELGIYVGSFVGELVRSEASEQE